MDISFDRRNISIPELKDNNLMANDTAPQLHGLNTPKSKQQERLSPVVENYLLSLHILKEENRPITISQLAVYLKRLPAAEGLGTSLPSCADIQSSKIPWS